jgi:predicted MPP superfamily phosphohydrolase
MNKHFIISAIILFLILLASEYVIYIIFYNTGIIKSININKALLSVGFIFPLIFILSTLYSHKYYSILNSNINTISSIWFGVIFCFFITSFIIFLLLIINNYFNLQLPIKTITSIFIFITFIFVIYGVINSNNPKIVNWDIKSERLSKDWSDKKIVMISDVHLGTIRRERFLKNIITKIEKENPDVIFILGDLIDGSVFPYEKWLNEFISIKPQFGILYVEGNHEKYNQEYDKFKSQIPSEINNLTNKKITINNTQIIGLDYYEIQTEDKIRDTLKSLDYNQEQQSIILIHDPKDTKYIADKNASLVLSGHTHGGQIFPFTIPINILYKQYAHGVSYTGETASVTSYGIGTSLIPMRIGTIPEIIILKIK